MRHTKKILIAIVAGTLLAGCFHQQAQTPSPVGLPIPDESSQPPAGQASLEIKDFAYSPAVLTVKAGETVTVTNRDTAGHSVSSDDGSSFDTGVFGKDRSESFAAPETPGTYEFHCTPHPSIKGTLVVE